MADTFDPQSVNLDTTDFRDIVCYMTAGKIEYNGHLGARISAIFVILCVSLTTTLFPVLATRVHSLRIPLYVYLFARYFGAGVIIATAFIHLLDPAYYEIGPTSCVGMTGHWASFSWPPAIALTSGMFIFLLDFGAEYYVQRKYGEPTDVDIGNLIAVGGLDLGTPGHDANGRSKSDVNSSDGTDDWKQLESNPIQVVSSFQSQIAAFLILEFGVLFHSVIIGLNLGVVGASFSTLYPVLAFHQAFEGLGIGARLSAIPFPPRLRWMPWTLCLAYAFTTPISIAIGLGVNETYNSASYTANMVSGILDSVSAGILIYTGFVEMIARDFLFNPQRTNDRKRLLFMLFSLYLGAAIMALLGKWA